jgi:hypothetical protein
MKKLIILLFALIFTLYGYVLKGSNTNCFNHYLGEYYGGGIIFHLWKDENKVEHGLIVSLKDISKFIWSNIDNTEIGNSSRSSWDGISNSNAIINQKGHRKSASKLCLDYITNEFDDWYLPSIDELSLLFHSRFEVNKSISKIKEAVELSIEDSYWSSTESKKSLAWNFMFNTGHAYDNSKSNIYLVRAIRSF